MNAVITLRIEGARIDPDTIKAGEELHDLAREILTCGTERAARVIPFDRVIVQTIEPERRAGGIDE